MSTASWCASPGRDADAIGQPVPPLSPVPDDVTLDDVEGLVWQTLKTCYDPEIPVDIVELGLIYVCDVIPIDDEQVRVLIKMTLTAPGCGMGERSPTRLPTRCLRCRAWPRSRSTWCSTRPGRAITCPRRRSWRSGSDPTRLRFSDLSHAGERSSVAQPPQPPPEQQEPEFAAAAAFVAVRLMLTRHVCGPDSR